MPALRPQSPAHVGPAFRAALDGFDPARPALILGHFDADGLAATAILARALDHAGWPAEIRITGKGENPWSLAMGRELQARRPGGLIATDLGIREGDILPGVPTVLVDHHVPSGTPGGATAISGNGWVPEPTSALLAFWCAEGLGQAEGLSWLATLGLIGDMATGDFPELAAAQARYGKTALREAVALVNAPRRTARADAGPALELLLKCDGPKELVKGDHPETALLRQARADWNDFAA